jgi:hypothetical protein
MITRRPWLALFLAAGCQEPADPLGLDVLADLGIAQGDAVGQQWSGDYTVSYDSQPCDCPDAQIGATSVAVCAEFVAGLSLAQTAQISQSDGLLVLSLGAASPIDFTGAIQADGATTVIAIQDSSEGFELFAAQLRARIDAEFTGGESAELQGELRARIILADDVCDVGTQLLAVRDPM